MKTILKITFIVCLTLLSINSLFAQKFHDMEERKEKGEAMKIGYITKELDLTPQEATVFWPVYNLMQKDLQALRKERRVAINNALINYDSMKDKEVEEFVDGEIAFRQKELDVRKKYHPQLKTVLPIKKLAKLYRAEGKAKQKMKEKVKVRKEIRD